jgi:tRNA isopentenyl-2-thiomethyl-A-37 hydroxylase MiaE
MEAHMDASECRRYAELCIQLADELGPKYHGLLQEMAKVWREAAALLEQSEYAPLVPDGS